MDKFGIFKLLNSFYNFYEKNKTDAFTVKNQSEKPPVNSGSPSSGNDNTAKTATPVANRTPLQRSMLSTMTSHDDFVKRVMEKNAKPPGKK